MKSISIQQILTWLTGATLHSKTHVSLNHTCYGVNTDTRTLRANNLFVALKGERFDGHRFINFAARNQAALALVNYDSEELAKQNTQDMPIIRVPNTAMALQELAAGYRQQFQLPLAIVVGSNGKTTTKEMLNSIFRTHLAIQGNERAAHSTSGNFNNDIGLPLTLLKLNEHHRLSVIELGMNHPGETAQLAPIAAPTIAIINNAQREHQEFMHTVEAVAKEHSAVIPALSSNGTVVLPAQDNHVKLWRDCATTYEKKVVDFALHTQTDNTPALITGTIQTTDDKSVAQVIKIHTPVGDATVKLNIAGEHHARNALAATAAAIAADIPLSSIVVGLQAFEPVKGRMQSHRFNLFNKTDEIQLIDDSYNANPDSVIAAINLLSDMKHAHTRTVLVLGDMGEVGEQGKQFHAEVGVLAATKQISALYTVGHLMEHAHIAFKNNANTAQCDAHHFASTAELQATLLTNNTLRHNDTVLVKGSRFMRMESIVEGLINHATTTGAH